jgi:hypothetical protein
MEKLFNNFQFRLNLFSLHLNSYFSSFIKTITLYFSCFLWLVILWIIFIFYNHRFFTCKESTFAIWLKEVCFKNHLENFLESQTQWVFKKKIKWKHKYRKRNVNSVVLFQFVFCVTKKWMLFTNAPIAVLEFVEVAAKNI